MNLLIEIYYGNSLKALSQRMAGLRLIKGQNDSFKGFLR